RDAQLLAVERGALAAGRVEDLVAQRIDGAAGEGTTVFLRRDSAAEERNAVRVVGGAVERIDDEARGAARTAFAAFFGEDRDAGGTLAQHFQDHLFRSAIRVGDQVDAALEVDVARAVV